MKALAQPILTHRLVLSTDAELSDVSTAAVTNAVLDAVEAPAGDYDTEADVPTVSDGSGDTDPSADREE